MWPLLPMSWTCLQYVCWLRKPCHIQTLRMSENLWWTLLVTSLKAAINPVKCTVFYQIFTFCSILHYCAWIQYSVNIQLHLYWNTIINLYLKDILIYWDTLICQLPIHTFRALEKSCNTFCVSELQKVCVYLCVCVGMCVKMKGRRESESGSILLTCLPWCPCSSGQYSGLPLETLKPGY